MSSIPSIDGSRLRSLVGASLPAPAWQPIVYDPSAAHIASATRAAAGSDRLIGVDAMRFVAARSIKRVTVAGRPPVAFSPSIFFSGTQYHLWFLPFLLILSIAAAFLHAAIVRRRDARAPIALALALGVAGLLFSFATPT